MKEKITIIIPVYNPGDFLKNCLESLLCQSMKDFCIIAIDDGSTDESWSILQQYEKIDDRVKILKNPCNMGAALTRNKGLDLANGEYVVFVDSDDYFECDYLESLLECCNEYDLDIALCDFFWQDESTGEVRIISPCKRFGEIIDKPFSVRMICNSIFQIFSPVPFIRMYRKSFLMENMLWFQNISNSNDIYLSQISLVCAKNMMHVSKALVHYRYNTGKQISTVRWKKPECGYYAVREIYNWLLQRNQITYLGDSFFKYALSVAGYWIKNIGEEKNISVRNNWEREWFPSLEINRNNISVIHYYRYAFFMEIELDVIRKREFAFAAFWEEARNRNLKIAHWGYGKIGKHFCSYAQKNGYLVIEVYDRNSKLWSSNSIIPIKSFANSNKDVDIIVMTNPSFENDIVREIQASSYNVKLFDFSAYICGVDFDTCIF